MLLQVLHLENFQFTAYSWPEFVGGVATAGLGLFVLLRERLSRNGSTFLLFCLAVSLYLVGSSLTYASSDQALAAFFIRITQTGAVLIPSTGFLLTVVRLGLFRRFRLVAAVLFACSLLFVYGIFFTGAFVGEVRRFFLDYMPLYGPLGHAFILFFVAVMATNFYLYLREYRNCVTERQRRRLRGTLMSFAGGTWAPSTLLRSWIFPFIRSGTFPSWSSS
jgi:hypothetical protein